jgi:DNA repair exonuclease SbcCD nuclease subunit
MKIILWADVHCEHSVHGNNARGEVSTSLTVDWLVRHAVSEKPDAVFILGDLFDEHGLIESSLAVSIRNKILSLTDHNIRVVIITGNHEYQEVSDRYFGHGLVEAIFGGREDDGVYVIDREARVIHLDDKTSLVGLPYRATPDQFTETVIKPLIDFVSAEDLSDRRLIVGWHCGVPHAAAWKGDEPENAFISESNPEMRFLFDLADNRRIFCGHFHGPGDTVFGDIGTFTYVGSPATRSISESSQDKRVLVWDDGVVTAVSTGFILDYLASSPQDARLHIERMISIHGEEIRPLIKVRIRLAEGSSMDDYNIAKASMKDLPAGSQVMIDRPEERREGIAEDIIRKAQNDSSYTQTMMERDVLIRSIMNNFAPKGTAPPDLACVTALALSPDGEITDSEIVRRLFPRDPNEDQTKALGNLGRMLVYAVRMASGRAP